MNRDATDSRFLRAGVWLMALAAAGFMVADLVTRPPAAWLSMMPVYCLAAFAMLHSIAFLGTRRALWFLALGLILAFVAEYLGTNFGAIFGSHWFARVRDLRVQVGAMLPGRVPLTVVLGWYGQLYLAFVVAVFLVQSQPRDVSSFAATPLAAGLLMALWQLAAGPMAVERGMMGFANNGFYHGVPLSSFVGWFATAMFITLFFIAVEPAAADAGRFRAPSGRVAPLVFALFGASLLYPALMCFRFGLTGAAWLGVAVLLLFTLSMAIRGRRPAPDLQPAVQT